MTLPDASDPFWNGNGTYYIGVISDDYDYVTETDETNNASTGQLIDYESIDITIPITDVDLSGAYFDIIQQPLVAGDFFDVNFEIQNTEAGDANGFFVDFYLSKDATIDNSIGSGDILLGFEWIPSLAGNSTTGILSNSLTLPDASHPFWSGNGTYYVGVISDALGGVVETDETNNASIGELIDYESIDITVPIVDLSGAYFDVIQQPLAAGDSFDVDFEIQNTEADDADGFSASFYLSKDTIIDRSVGSDDIWLGSEWIPNLAGNSTTGILTDSLTLPHASNPFWNGNGTYYIGMISDAWDNFTETDETNNASTGQLIDYESIDITVPIIDVDLSGAYFDVVQQPLAAGDSFDVDFEIQNTEADDVDNFRAVFYLSKDATIDNSTGSDDIWLGHEWISNLAGNSTTGILSNSLTLPDASHSFWNGNGTYYIGLISDAYNFIRETDESNNASTGELIDYESIEITVSISEDNYEENDNLAIASDVLSTSEQTWLSSIDGEGIVNDDDYYAIEVNTNNTNLLVDLQFTDADGDIDLKLYDASGTELASATSTTDNESINYTVATAGTYYLRVYPFGTPTGNIYDLWWDDLSTNINTVDNDFDGDSKADIHWRNGNQNQVWLMDGTTVTTSGNLSNTSSNAEGNGDFNGDGKAELLFSNGNQYEIWEMNGTTVANTYSFTALNSNWSVVGIGDTDGDGDDDILVRNGNKNRILEIDNFNLNQVVTLNNYNSSWSVAGMGDTDGDGDDDILWRRNNANRIWEIEDNARENVINIGGYNASWSVSGMGDTDGDGDDDILWRKNNANRIWEIENNARESVINIGGFNSAWQVEDVEDYDGDGDDDILFRNGNKNRVWEIEDNSRVSNTNTNSLDSAWNVIA